MAMSAYRVDSYGQMVQIGTTSNKVINLPSGYRALSNVLTVGGNFRTPNPHSYISTKVRNYAGVILESGPGYWQSTSGIMPYTWNWAVYSKPFDNNVYNEALGNLYEQLRGRTDVSVDLMQWRQTLNMVSLYRRLVAGIAKHGESLVPLIQRAEAAGSSLQRKAISKRRRKALRSELYAATGALAKARLEYVYGWRPTVQTLQELAKGVLTPPDGCFIKAVGRARRETLYQVEQYSVSSDLPVRMTVRNSNRAQVVCYYSPTASVIDSLMRISSLNPVSIAYELIPYSFVLDWMVDFGGFFRSLETALLSRNDFVRGYVTKTSRCQVDGLLRGTVWSKTNSRMTLYDIAAVATDVHFTRTVLSSTPFPTRPVVNARFGVNRLLNALSLARETLSKADSIIASKRR